MTQTTKWIIATSFLIAAAGFLWPFWPLTLLGIAICALSGRWVFAVGIGLLLDVGYGAPVGPFEALYVPFTLFALVCSAAYLFGGRYVFQRGSETL